MKLLSVESLAIADVKTVRFARFRDERGYFTETWRRGDFDAVPELAGLDFTQVNESRSRAGVVRGLHMQWNPYMGKLVRAISGRFIDLALDVRPDSPTVGCIVACELQASDDADHDQWVWVPPGFAHGMVMLEDSLVEYFCTGHWSPDCEVGISPLSSDLDWSRCETSARDRVLQVLQGNPLLSDKDAAAMSLSEWLADPRSEVFEIAKLQR